MTERSCLSIVLAAGEGTRMRSSRAKVLHTLAGLPLISHVLRAAARAGGGEVALVLGRDADQVAEAGLRETPALRSFVQAERLGTGHAVLAAREAIAEGYDDILVMFGDTPLIEGEALAALRSALAGGAAVAVAGFRTNKPAGYGRLIESNGQLVAIREERDCSGPERAIEFCNGGMMGLAGAYALSLLDAVGNDNAKGEYYLTDVVALAAARGLRVVSVETRFENALGVNTRVELAEAEAIWQRHRRREAMLGGATLLAPETVTFAHDTRLGQDVTVEPGVFFGPGVTVGDGATIRAYSHLEGAAIAAGAEIGPFARLRPGAEIGPNAKIGNFCEVKKSVVEAGAKVNHLSYIGDAHIGAKANIGAGTITCNYDGFAKHRTEIGAGAFIGSNTALVAPVAIGAGAIVGAGSVITENVPESALALGRSRQSNLEGRAEVLRQRFQALKSRLLNKSPETGM